MTRRNAAKRQLVRQWKLLELVRASHQGKFIRQLMEELEISRPTLYRDLKILEEAGLPLTSQHTSGEVRVKYLGEKAPASAPMAPVAQAPLPLPPLRRAPALPSILERLREAMDDRREARISYTAPGLPGPVSSIVAPLKLREFHGAAYLFAWDPAFKSWRLIKASRIIEVRLGAFQDELPHGLADGLVDELFKSRQGPPAAVSVRLAPAVAAFAHEHPLEKDQAIEPQVDGSVIVRSEDSDLEEAARWVLGWGQHAEVLAPHALRERLIRELTATRNSYLSRKVKPTT